MFIIYSISQDIIEQAKNYNIPISLLDEDISLNIYKKVSKTFCNKSLSNVFLWESFADFKVINDASGWKYLNMFIQNEECIVFFNRSDEKKHLVLKMDMIYVKYLTKHAHLNFILQMRN